MLKPLIKIADTQFAHNPTSSFGAGDLKIEPKYFNWYRGTENINDIIIITESCFHHVDSYTEKIKIALLLEPPSINSKSYDFIIHNEHKFDFILTHQRSLLNRSHKYKFYMFGGCWILPEDRKVHEKTKNVSIIASHKKDTEGHRLRHSVIQKFGELIDGIYGNGYRFVKNKIEALRDYKYSIIIENEKSDYWLTEKLMDCFLTGTIPIYWGCNSINNFFDTNGIIICNDIAEMCSTLLHIHKKQPLYVESKSMFYEQKKDIISANFEKAKKYGIPEDYIWNNFLQPFLLTK